MKKKKKEKKERKMISKQIRIKSNRYLVLSS